MKYRIKKPEVENAIRGLCISEDVFIETLNRCCEEQFDYDEWIAEIQPHIVFILNPDDSITGSCCSICIDKNDIEEVVEYDPKKWNQWPKVRPIKKGNYRVEHDENGYTYKFGFYWNGHFWEGRKGYGPIGSYTFQDGFRFKPWYDEWEGKE